MSDPSAHPSFLVRADRFMKVLGDWTCFLAPLLTRLILGYAFYQTGTGKLNNLETTTNFFAELGIPAPHANALFISCLEKFGGLALMAGFATRLVSALLGATMIVALITADRPNLMEYFQSIFGDKDRTFETVTPLAYGMFLLWLLCYGPGKASLDALIRWLFEKRAAQG